MIGRRVWRAAAVAAALLLAIPGAAWAQSAFAGVVRDTSGAVMPGVTVEAASPVLIEKVRSAVTDENGAYRIVDLRPGTYTLTFSLAGFNTQIREGVELAANFVATINVDLSIGTLQESVTVSGASPVVDVQTNAKQVQRFAQLAGAEFPPDLAARFDAVADDPAEVRKVGVDIATDLCRELLDAGVPGIHFYTLNRSTATREIYANLGLGPAPTP